MRRFKSGNINVGQFLIRKPRLKSISLRNIFMHSQHLHFLFPTFPVMIMLPAFFAEVHGFEISVIGMLIFLSKLIDVITDPLVGWLNDKNFFQERFIY